VNVVSFVDRDMVMRYFGGGIGHLKNAPPLQVPGSGFDLIDPSSYLEGITVEEDDNDDPCSSTNEDLGTVVQQPSKDVVNGELVQLEDDEDDEDDAEDDEEDDEEDEDDSDGDEDTDVDEEGEDHYGYASA